MTIWHEVHTGVVHPWLCDQFGHLNVRHYANLFNEAMFHAYARAGLSHEVVMKHGSHGVAAIVRTTFIQELPVGSLVTTESALVSASNKTCTFLLRMRNTETGEIHATLDTLEVFFDPQARASAPIPAGLRPIINAQLKGPDEAPEVAAVPREIPQIERWHELHRGVCFPWHCDQYGHMNVRWYAHFFDDAMFHIWSRLGTGWKAMEALGVHTVTATNTTHFRKEIRSADLFVIEGGVARCGSKSVTFRQRMTNVETGEVHALQDVVEVFFDPKTRKSAPIPDSVRAVLQAELDAEA
jgi:acyl-CoA thioester hydrolase